MTDQILINKLIDIRDDIKITVDIFDSYFNKLDYTGFSGSEPYLSKEINNSIMYIRESSKLSLFISKPNDSFDFVFDTYGEITLSYKKMTKMMKIFRIKQIDLSKQGPSHGSTLTIAYIKDVIESYQSLFSRYQDLKLTINSIELVYDFIDFLNKKIINISIKQIDEINLLYFNYVNSGNGDIIIKLYCKLLHQIIISNPYEKEIIKHVNKTTEKLKSDILRMDDKQKLDQNRKNNSIQQLIQTNNLVPTSMSMPFNTLIETLNIKTKGKTLIESLHEASKLLSTTDKKFGFILISKIIKNPLEYNFWTLTDKKYLEEHKLIDPINAGINLNILKRYQTIIPCETLNIKHQKNIEIIDPPGEPGYFYIIETIDGTNYRFLSAWNSGILYIPDSFLKIY